MCDSKEDGGRRCVAHTIKYFKASIKSTRNGKEEAVKNKAQDVLVTAKAPAFYDAQGDTLISSGSAKAAVASRNVAVLKAMKENHATLVASSTTFDYDREYLDETDKARYDALTSDEERKDFFKVVERDDEAINTKTAAAWRADPNSYYDRVGLPSEHESLIADKNVPEEYITVIGRTTSDASIREAAIANLVSRGYSSLTAETMVPESYEIIQAKNDKIRDKEDAKLAAKDKERADKAYAQTRRGKAELKKAAKRKEIAKAEAKEEYLRNRTPAQKKWDKQNDKLKRANAEQKTYERKVAAKKKNRSKRIKRFFASLWS